MKNKRKMSFFMPFLGEKQAFCAILALKNDEKWL